MTVPKQGSDRKQPNWGELVKLAQAGDEEAFAQLCQSFEPIMKRYAYRAHLCSLGEDALSVGRLAVVEVIRSYDVKGGVPFGAYMERHIQFSLWNLFKKERKIWQRTLSYDVPQGEEEKTLWRDCLTDSFNLEERVMKEEFQVALSEQFQALPEHQQAVLREIVTGRRLTDIAKKLHISPQAVYQIKIRARTRLKKALSGME
jgi:RNA polymerase sigma factor (sigma-70 family)